MPEAFDFEISDIGLNRLDDFINEPTSEFSEGLDHAKRCDELTKSLEKLAEIEQDYSDENWGGMNESPVTKETVDRARVLLSRSSELPYNIPLPYISVTPSGWIEMEWYKEKDRRFAIRLNDQRIFLYTGLFGRVNDPSGREEFEDTYGTSVFTDESFTDVIKYNLSRLFKTQIYI